MFVAEKVVGSASKSLEMQEKEGMVLMQAPDGLNLLGQGRLILMGSD